ncbi:MAG: hypothetical protein AAGC95_16870 [Pseudomonadota bacterium]
MEYAAPKYLRLAKTGHAIACLAAGLAALAFAAFALGLSNALDAQVRNPQSAHAEKSRALETITHAAGAVAATSLELGDGAAAQTALQSAYSAAENYSALARSPEEMAGAEQIGRFVAIMATEAEKGALGGPLDTGRFNAAQNALIAIAAEQNRNLMEQRYRTLHAWTVWSARGGVAALIALALLSLAGAGLAYIAIRRTKLQHKDDAYRFHDAVGRIERAQHKLSRAAEGLRRQAFLTRDAGGNITQTTTTLNKVGRAFGEGAATLLQRLETHAEALRKTATDTSTEMQTALQDISDSRNAFAVEVNETHRINEEFNLIARAVAPGIAKTADSMREASIAFRTTAEQTVGQLDRTVISLRGGHDAMADALAALKSDFITNAKDIATAVATIHVAARAFENAGRVIANDADEHGASLRESAAAMVEGRDALFNAIEALTHDDGALSQLEVRLKAAEGRLNEVQAPGASALKPILADLRALSENAAETVAGVTARLETAAGELEDAAGRFIHDEESAELPALETVKQLTPIEDAGLAARRAATA